MRLCTDTIRILPFEAGHASILYKWAHCGGYETFFDGLPMLSLERCNQLPGEKYVIVNPEDASDVYGVIFIADKSDRHRHCNLHIIIREDKQRQGISHLAVKLITYYYFNYLNFYKMKLDMPEYATSSIAATAALQWEREGDGRKNEVYSGGKFHAMIQFGLTKGPFNKLYKEEVERLLRGKKMKVIVSEKASAVGA